MAGKGTYLGGSLIISFQKKCHEYGWEPEKVVLRKITDLEAKEIWDRKNKRKKAQPKKHKPMTNAERAFFLFAGRCAARELQGKPWPNAPKKISNRYKNSTENLREFVVEQPSYLQVIKNSKLNKI